MADTEWRDIPSCPNYQASSDGQIRSVEHTTTFIDGRRRTFPGKILAQANHSAGYKSVNFGKAKGSRTVHVLVLEAFTGSRPEGMWVNHKDGNKHNNAVENLEWLSASDNQRHAIAAGLAPKPPLKRGTSHYKNCLSEDQVRKIRTEYASGGGIARLAREYSVGESTIRHIVQRTTWAWLD
jgi:hypothetical protein